MKLKYNYRLIVSILCIVTISIIFFINIPNKKFELQLDFEENYNGETAQIYFDNGNGFSEENSFKSIINNNIAVIDINNKYKNIKSIRIDPVNSNRDVYLKSIELYYGEVGIKKWKATDIKDEIKHYVNIKKIDISDENVKIISEKEDMYLIMSEQFVSQYKNSIPNNNTEFIFNAILLAAFVGVFWKNLFKYEYKIKKMLMNSRILKNVLKNDTYIYIIIIALVLIYLFKNILFNGYKLSYTNIIYAMPPFNSLAINTLGPLLSDVSDQIFPNLYNAFVNFKFFNFWNTYNAFGHTNVWMETILNPLNYVYLFGLEYGQILKYILKSTIAFTGMYIFLKDCKYKKNSAFTGAIVFAFSSVMVLWGGWAHTDVTCMAPFLFWSVNKYISKELYNKSRTKYLLIFILILYLMLVAGMPAYVAYFLYLGFVYTLYKLFILYKNEYKKMCVFIVPLILSIVISGIMSFIYTGNIFFNTSDYQSERLSQSFSTLDITYLRTIVFPYWRDGLDLHINESTLFTGILFLFILPFIFSRNKKNQNKDLVFWLISMIVILVFLFTEKSGIIFSKMPLINTSLKIRIIVLFNFVVSVLSCIVIEYLQRRYNKGQRIVITTLTFAIPSIVTIFVFNVHNTNIKFNIITLWIIALTIILIINFNIKHSILFLVFIISVNMASFANKYMPLIDKNADIIPKPTASIEFLQNNQTEMDRSLATGMWNFFPNINMIYGIKDIRAHDFINTNDDMREYLQGIDSNFYDSNTRTSPTEIENYNLLSYASVKYVLENEDNNQISKIDDKIKETGTQRVAYELDGIRTKKIEQEFIATDNNLTNIGILLSTYEKRLLDNQNLYITIEDCTTNNLVYNDTISLSQIQDNQIYNLMLNKIENSSNRRYRLSLEIKEPLESPLAVWVTEKPYIEGDLYIDKNLKNGSLVFNCLYNNIMHEFNDNETIEELVNYSPRVFIANNIQIRDSNEEILKEMKDEYIPNTAFLMQDDYEKIKSKYNVYENSNYSGEVSIKEDKGDYLNIKSDTKNGCLIVLNDYFDDNWKAYVDGKEVEIIKANYLFRAIYVPDGGVHEIQFKYTPKTLYMCMIVTVLGYLIFVFIIINRKKIDKHIDKLMEECS